jgi:uncharacterized SAM-binding protein YcdF (DUF218 family)
VRVRYAAAFLVLATLLVLAFGEITHWRASRRRLGNATNTPETEAVVVLGFRNKGRRANYINRYRVRAGIRSLDPAARERVLVLCGGAVAGSQTEADLMALYARDACGFTSPIVLDRTSRSTWQNVENAIPLIESAESIKIVSNSLHAEKARAYLQQLRPDLATRLRRGADYRLGELMLVKPFVALLGLRELRSLRR